MEDVGYLGRSRHATDSKKQETIGAWWSSHGERVWTWSARVLLTLTCVEQIRLVARLSRYVNADHALLWLAARLWAELDMREPTFFGQGYGVTFESIPTALLHALGVPMQVALQTSLVGMATLAWWWLAWSAKRRGLLVASLAALAWPLLVSFQHFFVVAVIGTGVGRLLAALCAGIVLRERMKRRDVGLAVAAGGFAIAIDSATFMLAGPALLWAGLRWLRSPRLWPAALAGLLLPLAWIGFNAWFNSVHPDHLFHAGWKYEPVLELLQQNLRGSDRLLGAQGPELYPHGWLIGVTLFAALLVALAADAWRVAAAVGCVIAQLLLLFSLEKTFDEHHSLWFPAARMTLCTPMTLWFLLTISMRAVLEPLRRRGLPALRPRLQAFSALATGVLLLLTAASTITRSVGWRAEMRKAIHAGWYDPYIPIARVTDMLDRCRAVKSAADAALTNVVAFPHDIAANYACAALYPNLVTIHPNYERRWWVLEELSTIPRERMLLWGVDPKLCKARQYRKHLAGCQQAGKTVVALTFDARAPLSILRDLDFNIRPFGPGCHPDDSSTCTLWSENFRARDVEW